ncbi:MAG: DUF885 domain-containing protein [Gammaproteobacteria bacterium]|nr:DUF885 domain-containing protein [Gammaproteobacteria bacterium]
MVGCDSERETSGDLVEESKQVTEKESVNTAPASEDISPENDEQRLLELYRSAKETLFEYRAMSATLYGLGQKDTGYYHANQLESYSPDSEQQLRERLRELSNNISAIDTKGLEPDLIDSQKVMANITRYYAGDESFPVGYIDTWMGLSPFVINQINGPLIDTPRTMESDQPVTNEQQALDYIGRLATFDQFAQSIADKFNADKKQGWVPPKIVLQGALRYLNNFLKAKPENHSLLTSFIDKVNKAQDISQDKKQALIDEAKRQMSTVVYPAYQMIAELTEASIDGAREEHGIWAQPNGVDYYQDAILQLGDSDMTADQIHQVGLDEVKRITTEMDKILKPLGYTKGTAGARMAQLNLEGRFLYEDSEAGRAELLEDLNKYIEEMNVAMADIFRSKPPYRVEVRAFPKEVQDGAPGGQYTPPAVDGSKPGIYWINLRDMKANPKFGLKTLTYHEANPGHHWQVALNLAQDDLPFLRRIAPYNAYVEGWALYSELVAKEIGMYKDDPFGDLGRLQAELFRAVRLVVDTGLHHKKWTREQAIDYMAKTTGTAKSDVISEIERYMAWPGQALGYKLGMLKIVALREEAKQALGEKFDIAEFHDLVLLGGAVPMKVLDGKVKRWIESKQS